MKKESKGVEQIQINNEYGFDSYLTMVESGKAFFAIGKKRNGSIFFENLTQLPKKTTATEALSALSEVYVALLDDNDHIRYFSEDEIHEGLYPLPEALDLTEEEQKDHKIPTGIDAPGYWNICGMCYHRNKDEKEWKYIFDSSTFAIVVQTRNPWDTDYPAEDDEIDQE